MTDTITLENVKLTPGAVIVNHVIQVVNHDDVKVWHVDAQTKYAEYDGYDNYDTPPTILLRAGEETLRADPDNLDVRTRIELGLPEGEDWTVLVDGGRYEWRVAAYRVTA
jgi:hypothetical protein